MAKDSLGQIVGQVIVGQMLGLVCQMILILSLMSKDSLGQIVGQVIVGQIVMSKMAKDSLGQIC